MTAEEIRRVEDEVNLGILDDHDVVIQHMPQKEATARGAMALFGEKYGDIVRVVMIPGVSMELCGGTHARHTGEIGLFRIVSETGVAAGVRRIEAVTGSESYRRAVAADETIERAAALVRSTPDSLLRRVEQVAEENRELRRQLERARQAGGSDRVTELLAAATSVDGLRVIATSVEAEGPDELRALGDKLREKLGSGAAVLAAGREGRVSLICVVTDDLPGRGVRANELIREIAAAAGGSGGGKAHMAQGGAGDPARVEAALSRTADIVRTLIGKASQSVESGRRCSRGAARTHPGCHRPRGRPDRADARGRAELPASEFRRGASPRRGNGSAGGRCVAHMGLRRRSDTGNG
jgi:alanyl-tRNA synthetase